MKKAISIIFSLVIILLLTTISVTALEVVFHAFSKLNTSLQAGIATAFSVIIVAAIGYFANKSIETRKSVEQAMRPRKLELYEEFIAFFLRVMAKEGTVKKPTQAEIVKFFVGSNPLIVTFASNGVIEKWGKLRISLADSDGSPAGLFKLEELLQEIRRDLGHSKRGSKKGDLLRLWTNDIDNYLVKK